MLPILLSDEYKARSQACRYKIRLLLSGFGGVAFPCTDKEVRLSIWP